MGLMVEFGEFLRGDLDSFGEGRFGMQFHPGEDWLAVFAFFEESKGLVGVAFQGELLEGAEGEEGEHVAAGEGAYVSLFWIREFGRAEVLCGG